MGPRALKVLGGESGLRDLPAGLNALLDMDSCGSLMDHDQQRQIRWPGRLGRLTRRSVARRRLPISPPTPACSDSPPMTPNSPAAWCENCQTSWSTTAEGGCRDPLLARVVTASRCASETEEGNVCQR